MPGETEKLFSVAGRVYVLLRRETNRMIDVEWVSVDANYAREVIHLARATGLPELLELSDRIEETHPLLQQNAHPGAATPPRTDSKYMTSLR
jgi:hypothetical protein